MHNDKRFIFIKRILQYFLSNDENILIMDFEQCITFLILNEYDLIRKL